MPKSRYRSLWRTLRGAVESATCAMLRVWLPLVPRRGVVALARALGALAWCVAVRDRRIARANLDLVFGETKSPAEKRCLTRCAFVNFTRVGLDLFWSQRLSADNWRRYVELSEADEQFARQLLARGRGLIAVTFHFGNWEWLGLASGYADFPLSIITEQLQNPYLDAQFSRLRRASGNELIDQVGAAPRSLRALRSGRALAAVMDLNTLRGRGGVWVKFFGAPVLTTPAVAALALRTGAPVVAAFCYPLPDGRYQLRYGPEISIRPSGDEGADRMTLTQAILDCGERVVREQPEYWLWMYKRWLYRPSEDAAGFPFYSRAVKR